MSSGGDDNGGESPVTLPLIQQLDEPKPSLPIQNPNPLSLTHIEDPYRPRTGEEWLDEFYQSLPEAHKQNPLSLTHIQNPKPASNPSERPNKPKPRKFKPVPTPPRIPIRDPRFMTVSEKNAMCERARTFKWKEWTPKVTPSVATLPSKPHLLCAMHGELLKANVYPKDDIYSHLPEAIISGKPFNLKEESAYLLYSKRYHGKKDGQMDRKLRVEGIRGGKWRNQGSMDVVAGPNGQIMGMHCSMILERYGIDGWTQTNWSADEFISVTSEDGESAVVVLRCKGEWNAVENEVHLAEDELLLCYQQLIRAEHEGLDSEVGRLNSLVYDSQFRLGCALVQFHHIRNAMKSMQEFLFGFRGKVIEESINLELGLGYCSGGGSGGVVGIGSYYLGLKKKMDEKGKQKMNTPAVVDEKGNLLEADVDPLVSTPVGSTFLSSLVESSKDEK